MAVYKITDLCLRKTAQEQESKTGLFILEVGILKESIPPGWGQLSISTVRTLVGNRKGLQTIYDKQRPPRTYAELFFWLVLAEDARANWKAAFRDVIGYFGVADLKGYVDVHLEDTLRLGVWGVVDDPDNERWTNMEGYVPEVDLE